MRRTDATIYVDLAEQIYRPLCDCTVDALASFGTHKLASVSTAIAPADSISAASCSVHTPPAPMMGIPIIAAEWTISNERGNND